MKFNKGSIFWVESFDVGFGKDRDLGCFDLVLKHLGPSHWFNQTVIDTKIQLHLWRENCFHCFLLNGSKLVIRVTMVFFLTNIILISTDLSIFTNPKMKIIGFVLHLFLIKFPNPPPLTNLIVTFASSTRNWMVWKGISRKASKSFWILPRSRLKKDLSVNESINSDNFITVQSLAYLIRLLEGEYISIILYNTI